MKQVTFSKPANYTTGGKTYKSKGLEITVVNGFINLSPLRNKDGVTTSTTVSFPLQDAGKVITSFVTSSTRLEDLAGRFHITFYFKKMPWYRKIRLQLSNFMVVGNSAMRTFVSRKNDKLLSETIKDITKHIPASYTNYTIQHLFRLEIISSNETDKHNEVSKEGTK